MNTDIELLWHEYRTPLTRYVQKRINQDETIEDIVQLTFLRAWAAINKGNAATESISGWLFRIAHNLIIDHYRARDRTPDMIELDAIREDNTEDADQGGGAVAERLTAPGLDPCELVEQTILVERIRATINRLSEDQRIVVVRRMEGYEYEDIADELGKGFAATKMYQVRGWANLREWLKDVA